MTKPNGGTDYLTNVGGFWFAGASVWKPVEDVISGGTFPGETITGTNGNDSLEGTQGDDTINGKGGVDVLFCSKGDDTLNGGGAEYDQINYQGSRSDYVFTQNADGSITSVSQLADTDLILNIDGIYFEGEGEWYGIEDLV